MTFVGVWVLSHMVNMVTIEFSYRYSILVFLLSLSLSLLGSKAGAYTCRSIPNENNVI